MTTTDIKQIEKLISKALTNVATKDDLKNFATKDDLKNMATQIIEDLSDVITGLIESVDEKKADKSEVELIKKRVEKIEQVTL